MVSPPGENGYHSALHLQADVCSLGILAQHCVAATKVQDSLCRAVPHEQIMQALTANHAAPGALLFGVSIHKDVACDDALCLAPCSITAFMQDSWKSLPMFVARKALMERQPEKDSPAITSILRRMHNTKSAVGMDVFIFPSIFTIDALRLPLCIQVPGSQLTGSSCRLLNLP